MGVLCGAAAIMVSIPLPYLSVGMGSDASSYSAVDLPAVGAPVLLSSLAILGLTFGWRGLGRERLSVYAALAAGTLLLLNGALLVFVETASALVPAAFLPATWQRSSWTLSAGSGLWLGLGGAVMVLAGTASTRDSTQRLFAGTLAPGWRGMSGLALSLALLTLIVLLGWLRYQPWIDSSVLGQGFELPGHAAPWIGPASFLSVCALTVAFGLMLVSRSQAAGLVAAAAGWFTSFLAAITVIAAESLARLRIDDLLEGQSGEAAITFQAAPAAWVVFIGGLLVALIGLYLVVWTYRLKNG